MKVGEMIEFLEDHPSTSGYDFFVIDPDFSMIDLQNLALQHGT